MAAVKRDTAKEGHVPRMLGGEENRPSTESTVPASIYRGGSVCVCECVVFTHTDTVKSDYLSLGAEELWIICISCCLSLFKNYNHLCYYQKKNPITTVSFAKTIVNNHFVQEQTLGN